MYRSFLCEDDLTILCRNMSRLIWYGECCLYLYSYSPCFFSFFSLYLFLPPSRKYSKYAGWGVSSEKIQLMIRANQRKCHFIHRILFIFASTNLRHSAAEWACLLPYLSFVLERNKGERKRPRERIATKSRHPFSSSTNDISSHGMCNYTDH